MLCCATLSLTVLLSRLKDQLRWGDCPVDADVESDMAAEVAGLPVQAGWRPRTAIAQASSSATPSRSPSPAKSICAMNRCALGFCPSPPSCLFTICQEVVLGRETAVCVAFVSVHSLFIVRAFPFHCTAMTAPSCELLRQWCMI